ncbi:hypothetical protein D918_06720 [Trichuris suis]|nr:hypothetical protein D918_06720 [Trichuris suis]
MKAVIFLAVLLMALDEILNCTLTAVI